MAFSNIATWIADNGNGTFSNPLFYDEFSDPDMIRVGDDFYLTGTTMHAMPGLPVLHSRDLVNWRLASYACERLDLGPEFRLEDGKSIYGQGIWAPCFRHHDGTFFIFTNVNGRTTQIFQATDPAGPWRHGVMKRAFHDLSVLFDDDGKVYVVWGYQDLHLAQLDDRFEDIVPGTERILFAKDAGMGEGSHLYKIDGRYYITSAWYDGRMRMPCARAERPEGPYDVNLEISADEEFGMIEGNRLASIRGESLELQPAGNRRPGRLSMHQGGIVSTARGEWWGFSMMDYNSVGRLTCLSPVTWRDGWPYFGLPGNLGRTPRIWVKPDTGTEEAPRAPYRRGDSFSGPRLADIWQWNHAPVNDRWSLTERPGFLRLHALPAPDFLNARNTLTQRAIGPESRPAVRLDTNGMKSGDVAGLALLNLPYAWIGVRRSERGFEIAQHDQRTGRTAAAAFPGGTVFLRAHCDFLTETAAFDYSTDGMEFHAIGDETVLVFQLRTFQGVRYGLFSYHTEGGPGGHADFTDFAVDEPFPRGLTRPIPYGETIVLRDLGGGGTLAVRAEELAVLPPDDPDAGGPEARFRVLPRDLGRVALQSVADGRVLTVSGLGAAGSVALEPERSGDDRQAFQWTEMPRGDLMLLSIASHRHLRLCADGSVRADEAGCRADRQNGASLTWRIGRTAHP